MERNFTAAASRFHLTDPGIYVIRGYCLARPLHEGNIAAWAGEERLPVRISYKEGAGVRQKYMRMGTGLESVDREYFLWITLPQKRRGTLHVYEEGEGGRRLVYRNSLRALAKMKGKPVCYPETWKQTQDGLFIGGWAAGSGQCRFRARDAEGAILRGKVTRTLRPDILESFPELEEEAAAGKDVRFGFTLQMPVPGTDRFTLYVRAGEEKAEEAIRFRVSRGAKNVQEGSLLRKALLYYRRNGFAGTLRRTIEKLFASSAPSSYGKWRKAKLAPPDELARQRETVFAHAPLVSIVVPLYKTPENYLLALVRSVQAQTYANWELVLSDGSGQPSPLEKVLEKLCAGDSRIRAVAAKEPLGISENTCVAIEAAKGDYIFFADHDDLLDPEALFAFIRELNEEPETDFFYADEDKVSMDGRTWFEPHFKSDFNQELLCSMNYICHPVMVSRDLLEKAGGGPDAAFDGAQDYDLVLRCTEQAKRIAHIPQVLYHWRAHRGSTAQDPASKDWAFEAGRRAVQAHYDRLGIEAKVIAGAYPGQYRTLYVIPEPAPLVSVIIPNRDHAADLEKCVLSLLENSTYDALEVIIVENGSGEEETFALYRELEARGNVRVVTWDPGDRGFNYAAINNFGVGEAKGEFLLFLNNDTELMAPDAIAELVGACRIPGAGAVGARLFYPDKTIQHAGVIIGYGGLAGHAFQGKADGDPGYFSRIICTGDYSACTAACLLMRTELFRSLGGFDETLAVAFNDVDLCLRVGEAGYRVVYNPYARLWHYESKSRGYEDTQEKVVRFNREADRFLEKWGSLVEKGDPFYNPNLTLDSNDFGLRRQSKTAAGRR